MFRFHYKYFFIALFLLFIELSIVYFKFNDFIRFFLGDILVVILIYTSIRTWVNSNIFKTAFAVLMFSFLMEILQYFNVINILNLENNTLAKLILGTTFTFEDLLAYSIGFGIIVVVEKIILHYPHTSVNKKTFR